VNFGSQYADLYDALYHDKSYDQEAAFVEKLLHTHSKSLVREILDLGCGTGRHAIALAQRGFRVHGIDLSDEMLTRAREHSGRLQKSTRDLLSFELGDIRAINLNREFDAVISLFHVMSYQTNDADFLAALAVARRHLRPGGLFLFDFWHGPAVVSEGPARREKRIELGALSAVRRANPIWEKSRNIVRVLYDLEISDRSSGRTVTTQEEHVVRYWFCEPLTAMVNGCGFEVSEQGEWLTGLSPTDSAFSVYAIARAE
jgi:SAM-dependent methyltransferase